MYHISTSFILTQASHIFNMQGFLSSMSVDMTTGLSPNSPIRPNSASQSTYHIRILVEPHVTLAMLMQRCIFFFGYQSFFLHADSSKNHINIDNEKTLNPFNPRYMAAANEPGPAVVSKATEGICKICAA